MIDANLLVNDFEATADALGLKGVGRETVQEAADLIKERRAKQQIVDEGRAKLNRSSKAIGQLMRDGKKDEAEEQKAEVTRIKQEIGDSEARLTELGELLNEKLLYIPNLPHKDAPVGTSEEDNVVVRTVGYDAADYEGKTFKPHWEIGAELGILDAERAAKLSGSMFSLLKGEGARLLWALVNFGIDLHRGKYLPVAPPHFVRTETLTATGHLPKFADDAYKLRDDDLWAISTGEVPLMGMHRDEIFDEAELPKHYTAYTVCFRREAGSAGKDTRGLQRLHEFHKVELVILCKEDKVEEEFRGLVADAEKTLQTLELPYRVLDLCTADLTFSSARVFDLEVYVPGADRWLEVSSCGIFTDYQSRRSGIRYRPEKGKPKLVHALNGSGLATPRVLAAILEHGYQADGSVRLPKALVPYMGCEVIEPAA